jgi:hypothetical protein
MAQATWSMRRSAERKAEIEQWLVQVALLQHGVREMETALIKVGTWSNGWYQDIPRNVGQGGVAMLLEMSLKNWEKLNMRNC